ncbi:hypothetical protein INR49_016940, partial [Caranx melampygus]
MQPQKTLTKVQDGAVLLPQRPQLVIARLPTFPPFAAPGSVGGSATLQTGKVCGVADNTLQAHESQLLAVERKIQDLEEEAVEEEESTLGVIPGVEKTNFGLNKGRQRELSPENLNSSTLRAISSML